jgi:hypothetical protein
VNSVSSRTASDWAGLLLALVLLNASLTFANIWPTLAVRPTAGLSIELAIGVLALVLAQRRPGNVSAAARRRMAVFWVVLIVGRYADVTARSLYGRPINLYWDLQFVPDVGAMFAYVNGWLAAAVLVALASIPFLLYIPVRWAVGRVSDAAGDARRRAALGVVAGSVLLLWAGSGSLPWEDTFAEPVTPAYARAAGELVYEMSGAGVRALAPPPSIDSDFSRVMGADVVLVFLESYGAVSWERPAFARALASSRARLDADIHGTGRAVASAFVESTTFGGESWLAHISLLSGTEVRDQRTNIRLMAQERDTLVKAFGRHGYRTVAIMPGVQRDWPQGAFYGFDEIYGLERLDYQGPPFGWWDVTDQFALAATDAIEVAPRDRRPSFIVFPTISTHAPFTPAPPYQPDWARVLTPTPYDAADLDRAWSEQPDWLDLGPSYVRALEYAYATLGGYLRLRADRDLVIVLVGDHQPPALVSGEGASWDVPVHVIASRDGVLDRLQRHGFADGLAPRQPIVARMDTLLPLLLDAFGSATVPPASVGAVLESQ